MSLVIKQWSIITVGGAALLVGKWHRIGGEDNNGDGKEDEIIVESKSNGVIRIYLYSELVVVLVRILVTNGNE